MCDDYFKNVHNGECILPPKFRVGLSEDDEENFKEVNIVKNQFTDCYIKLKRLDKYFIFSNNENKQ